MRRTTALFALFSIFGCGGLPMRRLTEVEFGESDFEVAGTGQRSFQTASGLSSVAAIAVYAGLATESGALSVVAEVPRGCYMLVGTTQLPLAEVDVGATNMAGELVNQGLNRNDWYKSAGMAGRGFCLGGAERVTLGAVSSGPRMGIVLALYPVESVEVIVDVVSRLQNIERRAMEEAISTIASGAEPNAARLPWAADFPNFMQGRTVAVSGLPSGATVGMCLLVAVSGSGGAARDVDLYVFTGEPPLTEQNVLAFDDRINPNAAVAFAVPADPAAVRVEIRSFAGGGPIVYAAFRVREELCGANRPPIDIPNVSSNTR